MNTSQFIRHTPADRRVVSDLLRIYFFIKAKRLYDEETPLSMLAIDAGYADQALSRQNISGFPCPRNFERPET